MVTSQGFADAVGVSLVTVYNWERKGLIIPARKTISGRRYYSEEQIRAYLEGRYDDKVLKGVENYE